MNTSSHQTTQSAEKKYFNVHTTGIARVKRFRTVSPKKGDPFDACTLEALVGNTSHGQKPKSRFLDVRVSGKKAQEVLAQYTETINAGKEVVIGFCVGDVWADLFTYDKGDKAGQQAISTKGRLLFIDWVLVDNKLCYEADPDKKRISVPNMVNLAAPGNYFNLHTTGAGYLNRIRNETTEDGQTTYLSCTLSALVGEYGGDVKPEYRHFNVRVYTHALTAYQLVEGCEEPVLAESKVFVGFQLNDLWPKTFTYQKGENAGKKGVVFQSQLIEIDWVKIDGQLTYKAENQEISQAPEAVQTAQSVPQPVQAPVVQEAVQTAQPAQQPVQASVVQEAVQMAQPAQQPVQAPVVQEAVQMAQPAQQPVQAPVVQEAVQTAQPVQQPVQAPVVQEAVQTVQPVQQPVQVPVVPEAVQTAQPVQQPVQAPVVPEAVQMAQPVPQPVQAPVVEEAVQAAQPVQQPVQAAVVQEAVQTAQPVQQPVQAPVVQEAVQTVQPVQQPVQVPVVPEAVQTAQPVQQPVQAPVVPEAVQMAQPVPQPVQAPVVEEAVQAAQPVQQPVQAA